MAIDIEALEKLVAAGASGSVVLTALKVQLDPSKGALRQRRWREKASRETLAASRERLASVSRDAQVEINQQLTEGGHLTEGGNGKVLHESLSSLSFLDSFLLEDSLSSSRENLSLIERMPRAREAEFNQFWQFYPNKVGKRAARTSFDRATKRATFETIMKGLNAYVHKADDRPWCNPATWLNQDRWDDVAERKDDWRRSLNY